MKDKITINIDWIKSGIGVFENIITFLFVLEYDPNIDRRPI